MANITAKKLYQGKSVPVTMIDNGDGTYAEAINAVFDGTLNLTVSPASIADGSDVAEGATTATAYSSANGSAAGTVVGLLKGAFVKLASIVTQLPAALGQTTMAGSLPVTFASDQSSLSVTAVASGVSTVVSLTPTITSGSAYSSGNCVGGKLTLASAARASGGTVRLESIHITDKDNQKAAFDILFFDSDPTAATLTDAAATVLSTSVTKIVGRVSVATGDYATVASNAFAVKSAINQVLKASGSTSLYAAFTLNTSTPTYTSTSGLIIKFGFIQD